MKISIQNNTNVFVAINVTKEAPRIYGFLDVISPTREIILNNRKIRVSFLFPKFFNMCTLLERRISVATDDRVYNNPTYFSEIIPDRKVEFTYEERAMCSVKRNDKRYILFIFFGSIFIFC